MLRKFFGAVVIGLAALSLTSIASANPQTFSLSVLPQTQFVSAGQNALINYRAVNNSSTTANCTLSEGNFSIWTGMLPPGQDVAGQLSTPPLYKNTKLDFVLSCAYVDLTFVEKDSVNIKIR